MTLSELAKFQTRLIVARPLAATAELLVRPMQVTKIITSVACATMDKVIEKHNFRFL